MHDNDDFPRFKAAAIQAGPVVKDAPEYFDGKSTLEKAVSLINEAARNGARLIVFPESWMPSYCYWSLNLGEREAFADIWAKYLWSSIEVPGPETDVLCETAKKADVFITMGINERDRCFPGRMYNSILFVGPSGRILGTHRKICNTVQERLFHTAGDGGDNLKTVFKTEIGIIGGSICGEHSQLLLLYNWIMQGIQIHCSLWPGDAGLEKSIDLKTRSFCRTACCYGVMAAAYMPEETKPKNFYGNSLFSIPGSFRGGSGIIHPSGDYIAGPVYDQETILYGDIDLAETDRKRFDVNLTGIYSRWDLLNLNIQKKSYEPLAELGEIESKATVAKQTRHLEERIKNLEQQISLLADFVKSSKADSGTNL